MFIICKEPFIKRKSMNPMLTFLILPQILGSRDPNVLWTLPSDQFTVYFPAVEGETGSTKKCTNPKVGKPGVF